MADIAGKSMIQRVYEQCLKAKSLTSLLVATDDQRIYDAVESFGGKAIMTSPYHLNGTCRCAEVIELIEANNDLFPSVSFDFIVNIQGDEPCLHPEQIDDLTILFNDANAAIVTQAIKEEDINSFKNPNIVKVMLNEQSFATDFFRATDKENIEQDYFYRHIGLYGFRADILKKIIHLEPTIHEMELKLEQLRWLDNHYPIKVGITRYLSQSVDTPEDLEKIYVHL